MSSQRVVLYLCLVTILLLEECDSMELSDKKKLKEQVVEMFNHAYGNYMKHAFPADELMPLSCRGRYRGSEPSRGDVDDSLGNFTLTLVDALDTLAILGDIAGFEKAVKLIINQTRFDSDVIVSVFETNIRILGGLLGGHVVTTFLKRKKYAMEWYKDELLDMATDIGNRLLPAFNTSTGIPYPRVNLKHGIDKFITQNYKDTCTACAGTMILEFAALSRLTGDSIYEEKAHKAMDYLWTQRHRSSDLVGTIINIHNGDWVRRESGVGAGIDSYYEYVLKAYILLGDDTYLDRFNKHYAAVMKYVSQGPLLLDVHMHRPLSPSRHFMDALLAFWPGLQVLKGDIQPAIETHEMLFQVVKKHNFLPEAFTTDFRVHWGQHLLRPEFVESTYFLYKATNDPYYLEVGKLIIDNLNNIARVPCGFAAIKDVTLGTHDDQLDSFVLAETFKYLFLLFAEKADMIIDVDDYVFTTEAHLLPLTLSLCNNTREPIEDQGGDMMSEKDEDVLEGDIPVLQDVDGDHNTCPNPQFRYKQSINYAHNLRIQLKDIVDKKSSGGQQAGNLHCSSGGSHKPRLRASEFVAGNNNHLEQLRRMGIKLVTMTDGRIQLLHTASDAESPNLAEEGLLFMQEMIELSKTQPQAAVSQEPMWIQLITRPYEKVRSFRAGPAQFGYNLKHQQHVSGLMVKADPYKACGAILNKSQVKGRIAIVERADCMFIDKARNLEKAGAVGAIVIDHNEGSNIEVNQLFSMSGDGNDDVAIPLVFLFHKEGTELLEALKQNHALLAVLTSNPPADLDEADEASSTDGSTTPTPSTTPEAAGPDKSTTSQSDPSKVSHDPLPAWTSSGPTLVRKMEIHPLEEVDEDGRYTLKTGTEHVQVEVGIKTHASLPQSPDAISEDVISIKESADGSKDLVFRFDKLTRPDSEKPQLNEIYEDLLKILLDRTNFPHLPNQVEYLTAIAKLLENAFFGLGPVEIRFQRLFNQLANELEIYQLDEEEEEEESLKAEIIQDRAEDSDTVEQPVATDTLLTGGDLLYSYASSQDFDDVETLEQEKETIDKGHEGEEEEEEEEGEEEEEEEEGEVAVEQKESNTYSYKDSGRERPSEKYTSGNIHLQVDSESVVTHTDNDVSENAGTLHQGTLDSSSQKSNFDDKSDYSSNEQTQQLKSSPHTDRGHG